MCVCVFFKGKHFFKEKKKFLKNKNWKENSKKRKFWKENLKKELNLDKAVSLFIFGHFEFIDSYGSDQLLVPKI